MSNVVHGTSNTGLVDCQAEDYEWNNERTCAASLLVASRVLAAGCRAPGPTWSDETLAGFDTGLSHRLCSTPSIDLAYYWRPLLELGQLQLNLWN